MEIWSFFNWWGSTNPTRPLWKTLWPQNFLSQSECLILLQNISLEWLYHLNSFFVWQFRIMIETYRISFGYWSLLQFFTSVCPLKSSLCFYIFSNMFRYLAFIKLLFTFNIFNNINICLFSEKKLEPNTVQLHVYKEEYIYVWWIIYTYKKSIFDMKNKFKQQLRMQ